MFCKRTLLFHLRERVFVRHDQSLICCPVVMECFVCCVFAIGQHRGNNTCVYMCLICARAPTAETCCSVAGNWRLRQPHPVPRTHRLQIHPFAELLHPSSSRQQPAIFAHLTVSEYYSRRGCRCRSLRHWIWWVLSFVLSAFAFVWIADGTIEILEFENRGNWIRWYAVLNVCARCLKFAGKCISAECEANKAQVHVIKIWVLKLNVTKTNCFFLLLLDRFLMHYWGKKIWYEVVADSTLLWVRGGSKNMV